MTLIDGLVEADPADVAPVVLPDDWRPPTIVSTAVRVTAVLVSHDGVAFLPRTLDALAAQSRAPDVLVAVDTGSHDTGADLLAPATEHVMRLARSTSFGDAVHAALRVRDGLGLTSEAEPRPSDGAADPGARRDVVEWLWLLHDDSAPAPDCLERLLDAVDGGPSIGVAGCKQVSWEDPHRLLDVGFTTSRLGTRVTGVDVGDLDQGQLDHRSDVMAVGTSGMLVRRDLWEALGGFDPALAHTRGDLDLCRRAHLRGSRVVVVPAAVVAHAAASATGRRGPATGRRGALWARHDRRAAIHLRLASAPRPMLPFLLLATALAALARAAVRLAMKQPDRAGGELLAWLLAVGRPWAWLRPRRGKRSARRQFRRLMASPREALRQRRDELTAYLRRQDELAAEQELALAGDPVPAESGDVPFDVEAGPGRLEPSQPRPGQDDDDGEPAPARPGPAPIRVLAAVTLLCLVAGLAGLRGLLVSSGVPVGPALLPLPDSAAQLWQLATSSWRPLGLGSPGPGDPLAALLALPAWLLGSGPAAARWLLLLALPLAAALAWWAAGCLSSSRALRAWAAIGWAAAPSLLAAVSSGRLGAVLAHLLLPPTALAVARAAGAVPTEGPGPSRRSAAARARGRRPGSLSAASAAALLLTGLLAAAPALAGVALVGVLLAAVLARPGNRLRLAWVLIVPAALLLPWWLAVARSPRLLLAEPGGASTPSALLSGSGGVPGAVWRVLGWPADPVRLSAGPFARLAEIIVSSTGLGTTPQLVQVLAGVVTVPALGLGLLALRRPSRRGPVAAGCLLLALAGLAVALAAPVVDVRWSGGAVLHGWPGPGTSVLLFGLLAAAVTGLDGAADRLRARSLGWRHPAGVLVGAVAIAVPLALLTAWTATGWTVPDRATAAGREAWVHRGSADVVPAVAAAEAEGPAGTRTLVLQVTRSRGAQLVTWSLERAGGPRLGASSSSTGVADDTPVRQLVAGLLSPAGADQRSRLADAGVGSVLLLAPRPAAATLALDTAPGLVRVARYDGAVLWRVELAASTGIGTGTGAGAGPTRPARVRVLAADGDLLQTLASRGPAGLDVDTPVAGGAAGRLLVLAERADPGWSATLDGLPLQPVPHGWAQAFRLPAGPGTVRVEHHDDLPGALHAGRAVVLGAALLVAIPLPRRRRRVVAPRPVRSVPASAAPPPPGPVPQPAADPAGGASAEPVAELDPEPVAELDPKPVAEPDPEPDPEPDVQLDGDHGHLVSAIDPTDPFDPTHHDAEEPR